MVALPKEGCMLREHKVKQSDALEIVQQFLTHLKNCISSQADINMSKSVEFRENFNEGNSIYGESITEK